MLSADDLTVENSAILIHRGWRMWSREERFHGKMLLLCPKSDYKNVPDGTELCGVTGEMFVKGRGKKPPMDDKGGVLAFGILLDDIKVPEWNKYRSIDDP